MEKLYCRFPHNPPEEAVYILKTPNGCVCYSNDTVQVICEQHFLKGGMLGDDWEIIKDLRNGKT